jgi:putative glycerol-1-phosphate prenyltransferase
VQQVSSGADAILFLSLISGRNPELLIGQHVLAAPMIKQANLEVLSTGYMLVDGGRPTTASYISGTLPLPADKPDIAACTALAGTMLGLSHIYLDAGSGALNPVSVDMIQAVREMVDVPLIVGGGIRDCDAAVDRAQAGADVVVVGNITEKKPLVIQEIAKAFKSISA